MTARRMMPAAIFVLLLATFLRFHLLAAQSFWNDEGNSARLSERSIPAILEGTASDIHPPLYYLFLRGWRELAGETEFGLRSLSAFAGVLTVAVVVAFARRADNAAYRRPTSDAGRMLQPAAIRGQPSVVAPIIAGVLAALSPVFVYYSQETRMYALLALLSALSAWVLMVWLGGARPWRWMAAYTLLLAAGLYTHYFFPAVMASHGAVVLFQTIRPWNTKYEIRKNSGGSYLESRFSYFGLWAAMAAAAVLLYVPWIPVFLRQIGGRGEAAGLNEFAAESVRWLALGSTVSPEAVTWPVVAFVALIVLGAAAGGRWSVVPLMLALIPQVLMFVAGATDPAFFKFMLAVVPFLAVLAGLAWNYELRIRKYGLQFEEDGGRRSAAGGRATEVALGSVLAALTIGVMSGSLLSLANLYYDPAYSRADYRGIAARIAAEAQPNAGIILVAPNQWEVFTYYHRGGAPVYPLPRGRPEPAVLKPELEQIAATHDRLYALFWGDTQRDPDRVIERWLDAHTFKVSEEWVGDVRFAIYATAREPAAEPVTSGAIFTGLDGETITLVEYAVQPDTAQPGDVIRAQLVWSSDKTPARPYKIFLHLVDGEGSVVAQIDSEPAGGSRPTTGWVGGERVGDNRGILIPPGLPAGDYALRTGLYDAADPAVRLPVGNDDSLQLALIPIR